MKRKYFFLLFLLTLIFPGIGHTQGEATAIDSLMVELWPDYDRASVLVLLTGSLPVKTSLPISVTLPFPETARLNAVARIDSSDGVMKDDIISSTAPGEISFITPDLGFRVEYYSPYAVNENKHTLDFTWMAGLSVNRFQLRVQQPDSASSFTTKPTTTNVFKGDDGLSYYAFPVQAVPAGQSVSVHVDYTMTTAKLSVESLPSPKTGVQEQKLPATRQAGAGMNWAIVAIIVVGIILIIVVVWQIASRRAASYPPAPHHTKAREKKAPRFCPDCGNPTGKDDRFCGKCGSVLQKG